MGYNVYKVRENEEDSDATRAEKWLCTRDRGNVARMESRSINFQHAQATVRRGIGRGSYPCVSRLITSQQCMQRREDHVGGLVWQEGEDTVTLGE